MEDLRRDQLVSARWNASHVEEPPAPPVWPDWDVLSMIRCVSDFVGSAFSSFSSIVAVEDASSKLAAARMEEDEKEGFVTVRRLLVLTAGNENAWQQEPPSLCRDGASETASKIGRAHV